MVSVSKPPTVNVLAPALPVVTVPAPANEPKVSLYRRSRVAPLATVTTLLSVIVVPLVLARIKVPAEIVVLPVNVFTPDKVNVLAPALVKLASPEIMPLMVEAAVLVTVIDVSALIAAAVNAAVVTAIFLSDVVPPTAPVNVVLPLPAATVIDSVLAVVPLTVELNVTAELVVVNVVSPVNSTAPL